MPIHLNTHSYYSLLNGIPKPEELAAAAARQGHKAVALTDHNRLTGAIEFTLACQSEGVKPILGLEVNLGSQKTPVPALLFAMNAPGWGNLCKLSSWLLDEGHGEGRPLPSEKLPAHYQGLIALISARADKNLLDLLRSTFSDDLYLMLTPHNHLAHLLHAT
jgi:DNA polymerase III alpha subunit